MVPDTPELPPLDYLPQASMRARLLVWRGAIPENLRANGGYRWGYVHLTRLADKAIREYNAARESVGAFDPLDDDKTFSDEEVAGMTPYLLLANDHLETCVDATHSAVKSARALWKALRGGRVPKLNTSAAKRLERLRNASQHTHNRLIDPQNLPPGSDDRRPFGPQDPYGISAKKDHLVIGAEDPLTYRELIGLIENCYRTAELIGDRVALDYLLR